MLHPSSSPPVIGSRACVGGVTHLSRARTHTRKESGERARFSTARTHYTPHSWIRDDGGKSSEHTTGTLLCSVYVCALKCACASCAHVCIHTLVFFSNGEAKLKKKDFHDLIASFVSFVLSFVIESSRSGDVLCRVRVRLSFGRGKYSATTLLASLCSQPWE